MKKRNLTGILIALVLAVLPEPSDAELVKGLIGGWSMTDWDYEIPGGFIEGDIFDGKNGFQAGAFIGTGFDTPIGFRAEALYARKGAKQILTAVNENGEDLGEYDFFHNVDYLQIPALLTVSLFQGETIRPVVFAGPAVGFELSAKVKGEIPNDVLQDSGSVEEDLDTDETTDISLVFGGGVEILKHGRLYLFQVRYDRGLKEIYFDIENEAVTIMAGVGF
ncbi:MAG: porin family protein [Candidatus Krumholzibacteriia bacterium]